MLKSAGRKRGDLSALRLPPPPSMVLTSSAVHLLMEIPLHLCWNSRCRPLHVMHTCESSCQSAAMRAICSLETWQHLCSNQGVKIQAYLARKLFRTIGAHSVAIRFGKCTQTRHKLLLHFCVRHFFSTSFSPQSLFPVTLRF